MFVTQLNIKSHTKVNSGLHYEFSPVIGLLTSETFLQRQVNFKVLWEEGKESDNVDSPQMAKGSPNHINIHDKKMSTYPISS